MPAIFCYRCSKCDVLVELDKSDAASTRHMVDKKVCGVLRRSYKDESVNVAVTNLRKARR